MSNGEKPRRKIVQIAYAAYQGNGIVALCDDGTVWEIYSPHSKDSEWRLVKPIPQEEAKIEYCATHPEIGKHYNAKQGMWLCFACEHEFDMHNRMKQDEAEHG